MSINGVVSASWLSYLFTLKVFLSYTYTHVESKLVYWELLYAVILLQYAWMLVNWISIMNGDIVVSGFWPDVQTINLDQFYSSNSSSIIFFIFLDEVGFCFILVLWQKEGSMGPCIIVHHPCPHPPWSANTGDTWIPWFSVRK
jgi:hypothetical protein